MTNSSSERRYDSRTKAVRLQLQELMLAYSPVSQNSSNRAAFAQDDQLVFAQHVPVGGYGSARAAGAAGLALGSNPCATPGITFADPQRLGRGSGRSPGR
ncbi:hypothetical protein [Nocardia sp. bgisy134]|uniref:hypothetical protein n=1 Tax=Nocardia sp. bgisy134 TaxID=3413789 RepID=UPI003D72523B